MVLGRRAHLELTVLPLGSLSSTQPSAALASQCTQHGEQGCLLGAQLVDPPCTQSLGGAAAHSSRLQGPCQCCVVTPGQFWTPEGQLNVALVTT